MWIEEDGEISPSEAIRPGYYLESFDLFTVQITGSYFIALRKTGEDKSMRIVICRCGKPCEASPFGKCCICKKKEGCSICVVCKTRKR